MGIATLDLDFIRIVGDAVHDRVSKGTFLITNLAVPLTFSELGTENGRGMVTPFVNQFKEIFRFRFGKLKQQPFIQNKQNRLRVLFQDRGKLFFFSSGL